MGCDIHAYVEYKRKDCEFWTNFGSRFRLERNYYLFGMLANGVRSRSGGVGLELKGVLSDLSYTTSDNLYLFVDDEAHEDDKNCCTEDESRSWVIRESSFYKDGDKDYVSNPDWHSHTWLSLSEYKAKIDKFKEEALLEGSDFRIHEYEAVLSSMESLAKNGNDTRLVIWFDN